MAITETPSLPEPDRPKGFIAHRRTFWTMLISSVGSLIASLVLSIDAIKLAKDPGAALSCNINAIVSCGKVAASWQSNLLGFPNAFIGLMCEPVVITVAIAALGGALLPRWFMRTALAVYLFGLIFALWLFSQSYFVIGAFCPWCVLVTITTITVFASMLRVCALEGYLPLKPATSAKLSRRLVAGWDTVIITAIFSAIALAILFKYGTSIFN
ncbi:MAG: vitamin K epoxide reductase family protein [Actinobacteria bacterium]|nr:vitamin K epoxide reductase family protein [Actinomycetota bacterium]